MPTDLFPWPRLDWTPERLRLARKALGLSQAKLGAVVGYDGASVSRWENGVSQRQGGRARVLPTSVARLYDALATLHPAVALAVGAVDAPNPEAAYRAGVRDVADVLAEAGIRGMGLDRQAKKLTHALLSIAHARLANGLPLDLAVTTDDAPSS